MKTFYKIALTLIFFGLTTASYAQKNTKSLSNSARHTQQLQWRDSAFFSPSDTWQMGVFNPWRWQWNDSWAVSVHPLAFFIMPHVEFTQRWWSNQKTQLNFIYALSDPSWSLNHGMPFGVQGYMSSSCQVSDGDDTRMSTCQKSGQVLAPKFGVQWSQQQGKRVWTLAADWSAGFMLSGQRPQPLHTYAPIEIKFAALTHQHLTHWGLRVAQGLSKNWSIASEVDAYLLGNKVLHSPWIFSGYIGADYQVSTHQSLTLGIMYWNADQGAIEWSKDADGYDTYQRVRSHDFYPCIDWIWSY